MATDCKGQKIVASIKNCFSGGTLRLRDMPALEIVATRLPIPYLGAVGVLMSAC